MYRIAVRSSMPTSLYRKVQKNTDNLHCRQPRVSTGLRNGCDGRLGRRPLRRDRLPGTFHAGVVEKRPGDGRATRVCVREIAHIVLGDSNFYTPRT